MKPAVIFCFLAGALFGPPAPGAAHAAASHQDTQSNTLSLWERVGGREQTLESVAASSLTPTPLPKGEGLDQKSPNKAIYLYRGADRQEKFLAGAKREGALTVYATLSPKDAAPLTEAFQKKYGIKVTFWRSGAENLVQRTLAEARAGKFTVDVVEGNGPGMEMLYREKLLEQFYSPAFADIPADAFPRHRHYAPDNLLFFVMGFNTNFVKPDEAPKTYADLLDPKWAGKIGIEQSDI